VRARPIDRHVGERLRTIRERRELSLQALAESTGIDAAQLRAFEAGERIRPEVLYGLAGTLNVLIAEFFSAVTKPQDLPLPDLAAFASPETAELLQAWRQLDPAARRKALLTVKAVAGELAR
jgi:transcriptional regulator with XRE-family HTH domain